ncbi:10805_t:CDS:2 [Acaulospora colombiana]|uniref:10805_t:CDS:1 n=1 Tax=Acaulospora colombiana TaxID=27376 RepID=A0ACA9KW64_9GLOM|nr:10805_t:CDS:2 [Acaulospora colombiana]
MNLALLVALFLKSHCNFQKRQDLTGKIPISNILLPSDKRNSFALQNFHGISDDDSSSATTTYITSSASNGGPTEVKTFTTGGDLLNDDFFKGRNPAGVMTFTTGGDLMNDDFFKELDPTKSSSTTTFTISSSTNGKPAEVKTFTYSGDDIPVEMQEEFARLGLDINFTKPFWTTNLDFDKYFNAHLGIDYSSPHVKIEKPTEQPSGLPEEYSYFVKPHKKEHRDPIPCPCDNRKRALLIGINYIGTPHNLNGCINDVRNIKNFLIKYWGFPEENVTVLTDDQKDPTKIPTRENCIKAMKALVANPEKGDSGHGGQQVDPKGDEDDGYDETIMPLDFQTKGQIVDDEMHYIMVDSLPPGVRLTAIFDSCHSGTVLDLPYIYSTRGYIKQPKIIEGGRKKNTQAGENIRRRNYETKSSPADVIMFSGCKDEQTSSDVTVNGVSSGAMSHAFIEALTTDKTQTYNELLNNIRRILHGKHLQRPQLSA